MLGRPPFPARDPNRLAPVLDEPFASPEPEREGTDGRGAKSAFASALAGGGCVDVDNFGGDDEVGDDDEAPWTWSGVEEDDAGTLGVSGRRA